MDSVPLPRRVRRPAVIALALVLAGCANAGGHGPDKNQANVDKLVVWDWLAAESDVVKPYLRLAKADFTAKHPGVAVEYVAVPFAQYYTRLDAAIKAGKAPDLALLNGGGQTRSRAGQLLSLEPYIGSNAQRLTGWDAFRKDGRAYAAPITLQGHPIYYNMAIYRKAGLDPQKPPKTWEELLSDCTRIKKVTGLRCFAAGNKEGYGIQWFMSAFGSGILTPAEYDAWISGKRDWNSPHVKKIFQLWKQVNDLGLNNPGVNTTALFSDSINLFQGSKTANMIGLMGSRPLGAAIGRDNLGVMMTPRITPGAMPSLAYDGGVGFGVLTSTKNPTIATDLLTSLTAAEPLAALYIDSGNIVSDISVKAPATAEPAAAQIVGEVADGKPALHVALSAATQTLMGTLSNQVLLGKVTIDGAVQQLGAVDQAG